ncbi:putative serine/threonine protein kinase [Phycisphaera mikurensis NBRC 102666]|uniref:non-specific serine/threonine protein kinase n=1 Tax=Phycisphaera mikurensis (strain NBRC 102666 / KCTC 22515 / FYK2301M01) TaxID=1142394 RepID=I0IH55_PHYMF|nr:putative serine/threonine protein kinase [Phycisphaera mikurensis NBRC 102666]
MVTRNQLERLRPEADRGAGQQIPGYQVLRKLGAGAMATVYKAKQISLDRMVAIKVLPQKFTKSEDFVQRFYAEGRAAAKLNHPNIVQAFDVANAGPYHYFVMEFVDGRTVFDDIVAKGRYDEHDALKVAIDVTEALAHAHSQGFIHRDVKPKNIMIDDHSGRTKLADMGLARAISDREAAEAEAGKAYGTPYYISPEQIRGEVNVDFRADIYSLGATLYHMVTGKVPFDGANPSAVMRKHLNEQIVPPDHINPNLVSGVAEVIEVCMAKSPDQRYNSTGDLLADLQAIDRGEPPLQARRVFDVNSLSDLERGGGLASAAADGLGAEGARGPDGTLMMWLAVIGWVTALGVLLMLFGVLVTG